MDQAYQQAMARRTARLLDNYSVAGKRGVEVGPLSRPVVRRDEAEVYYVDHCSTEELKEKYSGDHAHMDGIEDIDFIWGEQSLLQLLDDKAPLDFIVAAHVIEHIPDLRGWLGEMYDALKVGGRLLLIVPDKRFTFDIYRRLSSFEEVMQAAAEKRRRPGLRTVMDHFANVVTAPTWHLWDDFDIAQDLKYHHGPEFLISAMQDYEEGRYVDVHAWVFTPWHFLYLMGRMVRDMGLNFDLKFFLTTQDHDLEFYVQLERVDSPTTDWSAEASKAREEALFPPNSLEQNEIKNRERLEDRIAILEKERQDLLSKIELLKCQIQALSEESESRGSQVKILASQLREERSVTMLARAKVGIKARLGPLMR